MSERLLSILWSDGLIFFLVSRLLNRISLLRLLITLIHPGMILDNAQ